MPPRPKSKTSVVLVTNDHHIRRQVLKRKEIDFPTFTNLLLEGCPTPMMGSIQVEGSSGAEVFNRYISGSGSHLVDLTRQMPYGDRWTVRYRRGLEGIEGMLPEADIWPTYRRSKDWALKAPRKRAAKRRPAGRA
ncbi:hypothetical protein CENSYa_2052 [Cenarchaeum symbiosum A]|uniref:Uncharacterized protein n=1 Tax=Cenarchaeum symbiosum (strain A) TaxID=414004 RepID=A0RZ88_CENSY|nr:hypothetical protein CENSYa_2052 [Cenarchaeum symbiosum A]